MSEQEQLAALKEAVRVRPSAASLAGLRESAEAWHAMARTKKDRQKAAALSLLIEMAEKVSKVPV